MPKNNKMFLDQSLQIKLEKTSTIIKMILVYIFYLLCLTSIFIQSIYLTNE